MRRRHFVELQPVCPLCRHGESPRLAPLVLSYVGREEGEHVVQGVLTCSHAGCQREYPIFDGIPLLVPGLREYLPAQLVPLLYRDDLDPVLESIVGDCCGPGSAFDALRQQVGSYAWDHYGDRDPQPPAGRGRGEPPGAILRLLARALEVARQAAPAFSSGKLFDAGCGPGRSTFALAETTADLVLGCDLNFGLLRIAARALRIGRVAYPLRREGLVFERREFAVELPGAERVDFWCCDAAAPPFASGSFSGLAALNVLDSTPAPLALLAGAADLLAPGGGAVLATPFDWSPGATPLEQWIGGHSQRGPDGGDGAAVLRRLLALSTDESGAPLWDSTVELDGVPWSVRLHDRSCNRYEVLLTAARRARR